MRIGILAALAIGLACAQTATLEVASIKQDTGCGARPRSMQGPSPGRLLLECITLEHAIQSAYGFYSDGLRMNAKVIRVAGGPAWVRSDYYDISAKADGDALPALMNGPMLQALLEDRFRLKIHRETEEIPVYALTVAKGGVKMKRSEAGSCVPVDANSAPRQSSPVFCGRPLPGTRGRNVTMDARGMKITNLADELLSRILDRPVVDKTGLDGMFDFHLEFTPDDATRLDAGGHGDASGPASDPGALSVFTAVEQQLGLKLVPDKGLFGVLVIDRVERPGAN